MGRTARYRIYLPETGRSHKASGLIGNLELFDDELDDFLVAKTVFDSQFDCNSLTEVGN